MGKATAMLGAILAAATLAALVALAPAPAWAAASAWASSDQAQVRLVSTTPAVGQAPTLTLGLHVRLEPGWKIYWRSPGDAGLPPLLDWSGSVNLARAEVHWPAPRRFRLFGMETFGYADEVVLPITVRLERPGEAISLRLQADLAMCKDICILQESSLALDLPAGAAADTVFSRLVERYRARVPARRDSPALSLESVRVRGPAGAQVLEVIARTDRPFADPDLLVEGPRGFYFAAPEVRLGDGGLSAVLRVSVDAGTAPRTLDGEVLTLTIIDGERALERQVAPTPAD